MELRPDAWRGMRAELAWAAVTIGVTCVATILALQLWDADLGVPFSYDGDANQNQLFIKTMLDHGWYEHNPQLGAPFGLELYDFAVLSGDNLTVLAMKALGWIDSDWAWVMNVFFLLTFPASAATAFVVARKLSISPPAAATAATLFALLPYHFIRGEVHIFIAAYYAVPIGAYLAITALAGRGVVPWQAEPGRSRRRTLVLLAVACAVVASAHVYYAAFTIILLGLAALVRALAGSRERALAALGVAGLIGLFVVANHLPNLIHRSSDGANALLARTAAESESYGLKLTSMVLPVPDHRIGALADLRERYTVDAGQQLNEGPPQALGLVASLGLAGLLIAAVGAIASPARRPGPLIPLATLTLGALVVATVGGLSSAFAFLFDPQLRAWSRMSVFIGFFGLLAVALAIDHVRRRRSAGAAAGLAVAILVLGFLDQTNGSSAPAYSATRVAFESDAAFVEQIEDRLGPGASVFQLPYEPFPEPQPTWIPNLGPYGLARGYLQSSELSWSYGGMKGREADWQAELVRLPIAVAIRGAAAAGFDGVYVDRDGYADRAANLLRVAAREVGGDPLESADQRLAFFDIRAYSARLRERAPDRWEELRGVVLRPVRIYPGLSAPRHTAEAVRFLAPDRSEIALDNPSGAPRAMTVSMHLLPAAGSRATVEMTLPGGSVERVPVEATGTRVEREFLAPPGPSRIALNVDAADQLGLPDVNRAYRLIVENLTVLPRSFAAFGAYPEDDVPALHLSPFTDR